VPFAIVIATWWPDSGVVRVARKVLVRPIPIYLNHHVGRLPRERRIRNKLAAALDAAWVERDLTVEETVAYDRSRPLRRSGVIELQCIKVAPVDRP